MKEKLAPLAMVLIAVSLAGALLRWSAGPPADSSGRPAPLLAGRQAAERSQPLAYLALAGAGLALILDDRWSSRAAGGLLALASGLLANLAAAFWLLGLLVGVPLLLAASALGRFGRGVVPPDRARPRAKAG